MGRPGGAAGTGTRYSRGTSGKPRAHRAVQGAAPATPGTPRVHQVFLWCLCSVLVGFRWTHSLRCPAAGACSWPTGCPMGTTLLLSKPLPRTRRTLRSGSHGSWVSLCQKGTRAGKPWVSSHPFPFHCLCFLPPAPSLFPSFSAPYSAPLLLCPLFSVPSLFLVLPLTLPCGRASVLPLQPPRALCPASPRSPE